MKAFFSVIVKILCILLTILLVLWAGLAIARVIIYPDYVANKETVCKIPAIHNGFTPQGVTHVADNTYIFSGYHGDELELYVSVNGESKKIIPVDANDDIWDLHGGGISVVKKNVYVTASKSLLIFDLDDLLNAQNEDRVANVGEFKVDIKTSFCFANNETLYVGEFYDGEKYKTDVSHHFTTPSGEKHCALAAAYTLGENGMPLSESPDCYISIRDNVQGLAVRGNTFILSSSYGLTSSELDFYNGLTDNGSKVTISEQEYPLYYLDSATHTKTVTMPAMSEGLDIVGDRVVILFESACNKYLFGKLFFADKLVSYPIA